MGMETSWNAFPPDLNVGGYVRLLKLFLAGHLPEREFRRRWLRALQQDSLIQSERIYGLLCSLFGEKGELEHAKVVDPTQTSLQDRATKLLHLLDFSF